MQRATVVVILAVHGWCVHPACAQPVVPSPHDGDHWCATGRENDARIARAEARAAAAREADGKSVESAVSDIRQQYGMLILNDVDNEVLVDNQPFDLGGQTLRFARSGICCFDATGEALQFDPDVGDLEATWDGVWGQTEVSLPFLFPFGNQLLTTLHITSDIGIFFSPQFENGSSDQYSSVNFFDTTARITPALRRGVWIWPRIVELYVRTDVDTVTITWRQRSPSSWIDGIDQRFQAVLSSDGGISFSYPDSLSWNTFGLVQIVSPNFAFPTGAYDLSTLTETPTNLSHAIGQAFTLPDLLPHTARNIIQARYGSLVSNVDLFAFYQTFYTDIVFYAGGYHSGNVLHMNQIDLSWNARDEAGVSILHHEVGHDWLYFGMPGGSGPHPQKGVHIPAAFANQTPYDSSAMGGGVLA